MRHRVTSLTTLFALAAGTMLSLPVWAATNTTWIDDPDNRGTEASPINLYDKNKWASGALPSATYNKLHRRRPDVRHEHRFSLNADCDVLAFWRRRFCRVRANE